MKSIKIEITLVPHGYQIDIDGSNRKNIYDDDTLSECRDFGEDIDLEDAIDKIVSCVRKLDKKWKK